MSFIWIQDSSLPSRSRALVSFRGTNAVNRIRVSRVSNGDVLRFNRVVLKKEITGVDAAGGGELIKADGTHDDYNDTVYHFHHPWTDPEAGYEWFRLGRIRNNDDGVVGLQQTEMKIPNPMMTDPVCVRDLVNWYVSSDHYRLKSRNGGLPFCSLSPLPCRRRSLTELQSCSGLVSDIVVRVTDVVVVQQNRRALEATAGCDGSRRKRLRLGPVSCNQHVQVSATVTDGSGMLAFHDVESRFQSVLQEARTSRRLVRLTRVLNQTARWNLPTVGRQHGCEDEVIVVPTKDTTATLLSSQEEEKHLHNITGMNSDQCTNPSQLSMSTMTQFHDKRIDTSRLVVKGSINSISFPDGGVPSVHLQNINDWLNFPGRLDSIFLQKNACLYRDDVVLTLETAAEKHDQGSNNNRLLRVHADSKILQTLCGDVEAEEWSATCDLFPNDSFGQLATNLVEGLFKDRIQLCWTLSRLQEDGHELPYSDEISCVYQVLSVTLPPS